ncbi:hypothetical protein BGX28_007852 [Mortierella sp. GBA30]|nr:hypothetical protein BGX28_007852 [Mortierella sp. GBA30]
MQSIVARGNTLGKTSSCSNLRVFNSELDVACQQTQTVTGVDRAGILAIFAIRIVLTGDLNAHRSGLLCKYIETGNVDLSKVPEKQFDKTLRKNRICRFHREKSALFKHETWEIRHGRRSTTLPKAAKKSLLKEWKDMKNLLLSHSYKMATVYRFEDAVDHIFYGQITRSPHLKLTGIWSSRWSTGAEEWSPCRSLRLGPPRSQCPIPLHLK